MADINNVDRSVEILRAQIALHEAQLRQLKLELAQAETRTSAAPALDDLSYEVGQESDTSDGTISEGEGARDGADTDGAGRPYRWWLLPDEFERYGRQLILPEIGLDGQRRLRLSSILVVGVGGLGCPAAAYLAGAGVRTLGLIDGDTVEVSNLHRQILHNTDRVGWSKVDSAAEYLERLNPLINIVTHEHRLIPSNALEILDRYDLVLDCTDHPTSRYLISDACVLLGKPLVSASALRTDGQLMALNWPPKDLIVNSGASTDSNGIPDESNKTHIGEAASAGSAGETIVAKRGPCYRCVFPKPPPAKSVVSCGEGGILGPVVGVMGVLQALEAIKIVTSGLLRLKAMRPMMSEAKFNRFPAPLALAQYVPDSDATKTQLEPPNMLLFSAYSSPPFRTIRLRTPRPNCLACSPTHAIVTKESLLSGGMDYVQFCGVVEPVNLLSPEERMSVKEFATLTELDKSIKVGYDEVEWQRRNDEESRIPKHVLIDVRERPHFELCSLPGSVNVPYSKIASASYVHPSARTVADPSTNGDLNRKVESNGDEADSKNILNLPDWVPPCLVGPEDSEVIVICQRGNDSQLAVKALNELGLDKTQRGVRKVRDVVGGFVAWRRDVDGKWPNY